MWHHGRSRAQVARAWFACEPHSEHSYGRAFVRLRRVVCRACAPNDSAVCVWEGYPPAFGRVEAEVARYT